MKLHWQELYRSKADDRREEGRTLDQFETILKRLTKKERKTINRFFDQSTERHAKETAYLYTCGVNSILTHNYINFIVSSNNCFVLGPI